MAKSLIIYPYADVTIQHSKSSNSSTAANLVNEVNNSTNGYLTHNFSSASTTYASSFSGLAQSSNVTLGKVMIYSISSFNLYLSLTKGSNATLSNIDIYGSVSINGSTYTSEHYNPTASVSNSARELAISNANINRSYSSISAAGIQMTLTTSGAFSTDSKNNYDSYLRIYNANVTISYDDVFDCALQLVSNEGISSTGISASEVIDGSPCTFSVAVQNGYEFKGWYDNGDFDGDVISTDLTFTQRIFENTTLYPKVVKEGVVPPEEDPDKIFYSVTISSINARTSPSKGTTKVESGTTKEIKITPNHPQLTLAIDNGVDISGQLVSHGTNPTYSVSARTTSGFSVNQNGYYESRNKGVASSAAVCRVTFSLPVRCLVTFDFINYAQQGQDYGIFGAIDSALGTTSAVTNDTGATLICSAATYNTPNVQTLTYEIPSGSHYVDIKYRKNNTTNSNNDTLQFKIVNIEALEVNDFYYTYDVQNINQDHSLNFVFGDVVYYFVNSSTDSNASLYPYGQTVVLPSDGYKLTIAPENQREIVTLMDNEVDVSSQLDEIEVETEKEGETVTVINYIYRLANVQAAHNLVVETTKQVIPQLIKLNSNWTMANFFAKVDGVWTRLSLTDIYSHNGVKWIRGSNGEIKTNNVVFFENINGGE